MASNEVREVMSHQNPALRLGGSAKLDTALPTNVLFLKDSAESRQVFKSRKMSDSEDSFVVPTKKKDKKRRSLYPPRYVKLIFINEMMCL